VDEQQHASVPLHRVRAVEGAGRLLSTPSRPACGRPAELLWTAQAAPADWTVSPFYYVGVSMLIVVTNDLVAGPSPWLAVGIAGLAALVSLGSFATAFASYRLSKKNYILSKESLEVGGHRVFVSGAYLGGALKPPIEIEIYVNNAGRSKVDIDNALIHIKGTANFLRPETRFPVKLGGGSRVTLSWTYEPEPEVYELVPATVIISLGDGTKVEHEIETTPPDMRYAILPVN